MHMADALLSPEVGLTFCALSGGAIAASSVKLGREMDEHRVPMMGVMGAFVFAAQMVNFTIPGTGSSGHLGGGMLLTILLGPYAAFVTIASVLIVQALFFADGGLLALGTNIFNLGVYPCFVGALILRAIAGGHRSGSRFVVGTTIAIVASLELGAVSVAAETVLSGKSELPFGKFALLMACIHLPISLVESAVTVAVVALIARVRPEVLAEAQDPAALAAEPAWRPRLPLLGALLGAALVTATFFAWFSSAHPDGLEWAVERLTGKAEPANASSGIAAKLRGAQEKTAILPDYQFSKRKQGPAFAPAPGTGRPASARSGPASWPNVDPGTSSAGLVGSLTTLLLVLLVGAGLLLVKRRRSRAGA